MKLNVSKATLILCSALMVSPFTIANGLPSYDNGTDYLTGDQRLSCEAILCLSQGKVDGECKNAMKRYYSYHHKKAWKVTEWRNNFLKQCPMDKFNEKLSKSSAKLEIDKKLEQKLEKKLKEKLTQ